MWKSPRRLSSLARDTRRHMHIVAWINTEILEKATMACIVAVAVSSFMMFRSLKFEVILKHIVLKATPLKTLVRAEKLEIRKTVNSCLNVEFHLHLSNYFSNLLIPRPLKPEQYSGLYQDFKLKFKSQGLFIIVSLVSKAVHVSYLRGGALNTLKCSPNLSIYNYMTTCQ